MKTIRNVVPILIVGILMVISIQTSRAVVNISTGDPAANTSAPPPELAGGEWFKAIQLPGGSTAAAKDARHIVKSVHVSGGNIGDTFIFSGVQYTITEVQNPPIGSDLQRLTVNVDLPAWSFIPFYDKTDETGKPMVVIGRGSQRGDEVLLALYEVTTNIVTADWREHSGLKNKKAFLEKYPGAKFSGNIATFSEVMTNVSDYVLKGWYWGFADHVLRWGVNTCSRTISLNGIEYLVASFDAGQGPNECYISDGDSSGLVLILDEGVWKLAGLCYGVDAAPALYQGGNFFYASLFSTTWMWNGDFQILPGFNGDQKPMNFYVSRISTAYWLNGQQAPLNRQATVDEVDPPVLIFPID